MRNVLAGLVLLASTSLAQAADMLVTPAWLLEHKADKNLVLRARLESLGISDDSRVIVYFGKD